MVTRAKQTYNEESIQHHKGLEGVRHKPSMYLGERGNPMVYRIIKELVDNALDEFLAKRNQEIEVWADPKSDTYIVGDKAEGVPVGIHKKAKISTLTLIFTELHAGGKFNDSAYAACFVGDTRIRLLDGSTPTLAELAQTHFDQSFWVLSCKPNGDIVPGLAYLPRRTKSIKELVDVYLDNGRVERCTPEHRWMLRDGTYCEAQDLRKGSSLMPIYLRENEDGRTFVHLNNKDQPYLSAKPRERNRVDSFVKLSRVVYAATYPKRAYKFGYQVHHANTNPGDDRPENLLYLSKGRHNVIHKQLNNTTGLNHAHGGLQKYSKSERGRSNSSKVGKKTFVNLVKHARSTEGRAKASVRASVTLQAPELVQSRSLGRVLRCFLYIHSLGEDFNKLTYTKYRMYGSWTWNNLTAFFSTANCSKISEGLESLVPDFLKRRTRAGQPLKRMLAKYKPHSAYASPATHFTNHKVLTIRRVRLDKSIPVYDISVHGTNNFLLDSGVVVHNSAGTHGVGAAAANAVCTKFEVWTFRDRAWHHQAFSGGKPLFAVKKSPPPREVTSKLKSCGALGTIIRIQPDQSIVSINKGKTKATLDLNSTARWLRNLSLLNKNLKVTFSAGTKTRTYLNKEGIVKVVKNRVAAEELEAMGKPLVFENDRLQFALQWTSYTEDDGMQAYVSCSPTRDGGTHLDEFLDALVKALAPYKTTRDKYTPRDLRNGLIGALNWNMSGPEFSSQVKDRLTSNLGKALFELAFLELQKAFAANKALAKRIIRRASEAKKAKEDFKKVMDGISKINASKRGVILPNILATARRCKPADREIFLVEGESAAGTAKRARNNNFQEVLRLQGKPTNALRKPMSEVLKSKPILNILAALGYDHRKPEPHKHLRVGRVYCLADADPDGKHINALILTTIHRLMPELFTEGRVFICNAPLYSAYYKNQRYFGKTFEDCYSQMPRGAPKELVQRAKGWGELPPEVLEIIAFHPDTRNVIEISPPKDKKEMDYYQLIMGSDTSGRKALLGL